MQMRFFAFPIIAAGLVATGTQVSAQGGVVPMYDPNAPIASWESTRFSVKGPADEDLGKVEVLESLPSSRGVLIRLELKGVKPGWHGLHFHEKGDCSSPDFKSAGAHVHGDKPTVHGLLNSRANESGDLPNVFVASDGTAKVEFFSTFVTLIGSADKRGDLLDADGSALVVHASADNHNSQPIGDAGDRVACAVLKRGPQSH